MSPPVVLSIAGTDSGGAAGLAADLTTFAAHGVHGACAVTAVTAQDTTGVRDIHPVPAAMVGRQIDAVLDDLPVAAVKTGMLGSAETVALVADRLRGRSLVVDPVLVATSGAVLGGADVAQAYLQTLLPVTTVVTPNLDEARALLGDDRGTAEELAGRLAEAGPAVVVTGGGPDGRCTDWVAVRGYRPLPLTHSAIATGNDHGTGCTFSAALAAVLAREREPGRPTPDSLLHAVRAAAAYTTGRLALSAGWTLGRGRGPIAHITDNDDNEGDS